jgi:hypothetical protein
MTSLMRHERHWTVREANAALAYLGPRVDELQALLKRVNSSEAIEGFARAAAEAGGGWPGAEGADAAVRLDMGLREMQALDIVVRDLEQGLIDFPAMRDGVEIYLCWLRTEPAVTHYHAPEAGFSGRQPL